MPELSLLRACVRTIRLRKPGPVLFVDIGANVGQHTLFMAPIVDQVIAFEPYPPLQAQFKEKMALNNLANVKLVPFGLGEKDSVLDYYPGEGAHSGGRFVLLPDEEMRHANPTKLEIKHGDALLDQLGVGRLNIVKVDVEGFEAAVFRGLYHRIQRTAHIYHGVTDESRRQFGSEEAFRRAFYPAAHFSWVTGREGHEFELRAFDFETSREILITPPDMGWLREALLQSR